MYPKVMSTTEQDRSGKCQGVTWKGTACNHTARFVITRSGHEVCKTHLNAFPPGIEYTEKGK